MEAGNQIRFDLRKGRKVAAALLLPALLVGSSRMVPALPQPHRAESGDRAALEQQFIGTVRPLLQTYCLACHGKDKPQAQLDLSGSPRIEAVVRDFPHWSLVSAKIAANQMPPPESDKQPTAKERATIIAWIRAVRSYEARRNEGDPGPVLARRLSNAEYNYTIRDLTGVDLHPTDEFPVDPANQEGFDNSGESLTLSPALMKKYVQAAKEIADHAVLTSTGLEFASHPVLAETDRDKFCILRIVDFYKKQPTDYADYFHAAWRYQHRAALGTPNLSLQAVAAESKVSPRYLERVWETLNAPGESVGPLARLQAQWKALPVPNQADNATVEAGCVALRDWVLSTRKKVAWKFSNLRVPRGFSSGGQCFVLWKDRQYAAHRRMLYPDALQIGGVPAKQVISARRKNGQMVPEQTIIAPVDPELFVPQEEAARAPYLDSFNRFCEVFPDAFYIAERGRMFVDDPGDKGRLLTAGLHNSMGYFRDDTPLREMILDEKSQQQLDHMWVDFDTVAFVPERMHSEFFVYERAESGTITDPEFNFARAEDKSALSDANIKRLADLYLAKARRNGGEPTTLQAIDDHFKRVSVNIRGAEKARLAAEPLHRRALLDFARRAYRHPLTAGEQNRLMAFYQSLRKNDGLSHEDAIRDTIISILMSPNYLFRLDLEAAPPRPSTPTAVFRTAATTPPASEVPGKAIQPLSDYALASRLSYFLWSSMPDDELLSHAAAGDLHRTDVLTAQTHRMLRDPRVRALSLEFGGNWLDFRRFEEHNAVDRDRFPTFTNTLRQSMFEEPIRFLTDEFQQNRSALEMLYGKHTFVNATLAKHYEMTDVKTPPDGGWVRVDNADHYGRGGLLPMAVFLTRNSPGLRTSPVKRGYWVVRRVLGEYIPPPPATVPELPKDESKLGEMTLRQALVKHRENPACASCHARFDSYGLVFEGYGPIGERRAKDLGGKPVDTKAPFPGGQECSGVEGLQAFVSRQRHKDFVDNLDHKLFSYALGRSLQASDDATLAKIYQQMAADNYHFHTLVEMIVTSPQFRNRRTTTAGTPDTSAALARN